ncbi:MAG: cytochrome c biogenesis protein CcsA [Chlamydiota bacterium]|nr:cytochrome c biogenesis protein CcsA [Chlamydiota bacterium]
MNVIHVLFYIAVFFYASAFVAYIMHLFLEKELIGRCYALLLLLGFVLQSISVSWRTYEILQEPFWDLLYSLSIFCWTLAFLSLILQTRVRMRLLAGFVLFVTLLFSLLIFIIPKTTRSVIPSFNAFWFGTHILFSFAGYAAFIIAFLSGILYILLEKQIKKKSSGFLFHSLPSLGSLEMINYRSLSVGLGLLALGLAFGVLWGRWEKVMLPWYDPKIVTTVITLIFYSCIVYVRWSSRWRGKIVAYISIVGFLFILMIYFTVHYISKGHIYLSAP